MYVYEYVCVLSGRLLACLWLWRQITELRQHSTVTKTTHSNQGCSWVCVCERVFLLKIIYFQHIFSSVSVFFLLSFFSFCSWYVFSVYFFFLENIYLWFWFFCWMKNICTSHVEKENIRTKFPKLRTFRDGDNGGGKDGGDDDDDDDVIASIWNYWEIYANDRRLFSRSAVLDVRSVRCAVGCLTSWLIVCLAGLTNG